MITNPENETAIIYYQNTNPLVSVGDGTRYKFMTYANICMAWVQEKHLPEIMSKKKHCCGGHEGNMFRYANENDVRRWTNKGGG